MNNRYDFLFLFDAQDANPNGVFTRFNPSVNCP